MKNKIEQLKGMIDVQSTHGNWDFDPYMHGMANGMIYALSILEENEPKYLSAPKKWGKDEKLPEAPVRASK